MDHSIYHYHHFSMDRTFQNLPPLSHVPSITLFIPYLHPLDFFIFLFIISHNYRSCYFNMTNKILLVSNFFIKLLVSLFLIYNVVNEDRTQDLIDTTQIPHH
jgi:hypothetical protein